MSDTLADALPREIARVTAKKERWLAMMQEFPELAQGMRLSLALMTATIDQAIKAAASGDLLEMLEAYASLKDYDEED